MDFDAGINSSAAWAAAELSLSDDERDLRVRVRSLNLERSASAPSQDLVSPKEEDVDEEDEDGEEGEAGRRARALYDFSGKAEFRELTFGAGEALDILREEVTETEVDGEMAGWSLAKLSGEIGLIPRTYYTVSISYRVAFHVLICS